jgi:hypothetical protein
LRNNVAAAPFSLSGHQQALPRPQRTIRMNDVNQLIALDKQKTIGAWQLDLFNGRKR